MFLYQVTRVVHLRVVLTANVETQIIMQCVLVYQITLVRHHHAAQNVLLALNVIQTKHV